MQGNLGIQSGDLLLCCENRITRRKCRRLNKLLATPLKVITAGNNAKTSFTFIFFGGTVHLVCLG